MVVGEGEEVVEIAGVGVEVMIVLEVVCINMDMITIVMIILIQKVDAIETVNGEIGGRLEDLDLDRVV